LVLVLVRAGGARGAAIVATTRAGIDVEPSAGAANRGACASARARARAATGRATALAEQIVGVSAAAARAATSREKSTRHHHERTQVKPTDISHGAAFQWWRV
jgi:hypothetical protein